MNIITTHEITERVMSSRRIDPANANAILLMNRRVGGALAKLESMHDHIRSVKERPNGMKR
ncbi:hypothetical protein [Sphingomonas solaris]|uniref:Uncharacterized protein n=1 Tax=Alterirhizorhabdus solaris TaxID=2529389 RepID=A0A558R9T4_9SPHN|nr:hypothetical protein [Sphingomonas solaris]TVV76042.1 hypothetical protein FOY91_05550 [Sphingomonas solaris]